MKAKLLYAATLVLALLSGALVSTAALADGDVATNYAAAGDDGSRTPSLSRTDVRAELARATSQATLQRSDTGVDPTPAPRFRVASVAQWRVREEARMVAHQRLSRDRNQDRF